MWGDTLFGNLFDCTFAGSQHVGSIYLGSQVYFRGLLDEVQVYSRALVTSEVLSRAQRLGLKGRGQRLGGGLEDSGTKEEQRSSVERDSALDRCDSST